MGDRLETPGAVGMGLNIDAAQRFADRGDPGPPVGVVRLNFYSNKFVEIKNTDKPKNTTLGWIQKSFFNYLDSDSATSVTNVLQFSMVPFDRQCAAYISTTMSQFHKRLLVLAQLGLIPASFKVFYIIQGIGWQ